MKGNSKLIHHETVDKKLTEFYVQQTKDKLEQRIYLDSPEPSLDNNAVSTNLACAGSIIIMFYS